VDVE
jgi:hypothetical protein